MDISIEVHAYIGTNGRAYASSRTSVNAVDCGSANAVDYSSVTDTRTDVNAYTGIHYSAYSSIGACTNADAYASARGATRPPGPGPLPDSAGTRRPHSARQHQRQQQQQQRPCSDAATRLLPLLSPP